MRTVDQYPGGQIADALANQFDRLPPHSVESEMAMLGAMMMAGDNNGLFETIRNAVSRDDFFQADHQIIYDVACALSDAGQGVDALTVRLELLRRQLLEEVGGVKHLAEIIGCVPSASNGAYYARHVREKGVLRRLIMLSNDVLRKCNAPVTGADAGAEICAWIDEQVTTIQGGNAADQIISLADAADEVLQAKRDGAAERQPTGSKVLNDILGGLPWGGTTFIGGRPGMGKSVMLKQLVTDYADAGLRCGIVSLEETRAKIASNIIANKSGVKNSAIAYGNIDEVQWGEIEHAMPSVRKLNIFINDAASVWSEVARAVTALVVKHKCQVIAVDYLQLIGDDDGRDSTREQEVARISRGLKRLFKRFKVIGIAAVQLNRGNEQAAREPEMRDLRESGQLEQDGDVILLLHRPDYYHWKEPGFVPTKSVKVIVAKNKAGGMGTADLFFCGDRQSITDDDPEASNEVIQAVRHFRPAAALQELEDLGL